jgi:hypothetical protein
MSFAIPIAAFAPERAVERIRSGVRSSLWMAAPLMTEVATRWITDGTGERLAKRKLAELEARHAIVRDVFGERFEYQTQPHSLHLWVQLTEPVPSDERVAQAKQRGVLVAGAEAFVVGRDVPHREALRRGHRGDLGRGLRGMLGPVRRDPLEARIQANVPNASAAPFANAGSARLYLRR